MLYSITCLGASIFVVILSGLCSILLDVVLFLFLAVPFLLCALILLIPLSVVSLLLVVVERGPISFERALAALDAYLKRVLFRPVERAIVILGARRNDFKFKCCI